MVNIVYDAPIHRGLKVLDPTLFFKVLPVVAVKMLANQTGKFIKVDGQRYILRAGRVGSIVRDPTSPPHRLVYTNCSHLESVPKELQEIVEREKLEMVQSSFRIEYDYWNADQILQATLPLELLEESPVGFTQVGHIGHINLRDNYLPHKYLIGQVILDKNIALRTVVNKLNVIDNVYRNFKMEVIAGEDDYVVSTSEGGCTYQFDFSHVYWNSRLSTEHGRLVDSFSENDVVVDAFAGVGPFAIPAGKKGCGVLASDLNPASASALRENARINKVNDTVRTSNEDAREFIRRSVLDLWTSPFPAYAPRISLKAQQRRERRERHTTLDPSAEVIDASSTLPITPLPSSPPTPRRLVNHFVMNLPNTAIEFLDAFRGLYIPLRQLEGASEAIDAAGEDNLPMVHCYCFTRAIDGAEQDLCERASWALGIQVTPQTKDFRLRWVRDVAPTKEMYCLEFRLTKEMVMTR